jgi:2,5-diamino-6-(ribosylamino)-4(3H)-pyrimidinone 5'-phosphate reductase
MLPEIIIHNSVSTDGSLTGFMPDMGLHYKIAFEFKPDAHLIGADTIIAGNEMFGEETPEESSSDFEIPDRDPSLPLWIITDSRGRLQGMLHTCRRFEYCRDVIVLVSDSTPESYLIHLQERNYRFLKTGNSRIDIKEALDQLNRNFDVNRIVTDTGKVLGNLLINLRLVKEISLLVHPVIIVEKHYPMFQDIIGNLDLKLIKSESYENGCVWNVYQI